LTIVQQQCNFVLMIVQQHSEHIFCNLSQGWSKACLFLWLVIAQPQCMRAMWLMTSQQLCMLAFVAADCSAAMHACFVVVGDCSAAKHA